MRAKLYIYVSIRSINWIKKIPLYLLIESILNEYFNYSRFLCYVCLGPIYCEPNADSVPGCALPLRFSLAFIDYIQRKKSNTDDAEYLTPVTTDVMQVNLRSLNNVM